jgi:hypothetical protein
MTTKHFSEAELLETYYMQPGESAPVMLHLAQCDACIERYNRLEKKLRDAAASSCPTKPATFWSFQRGSIMRRVDAARRDVVRQPRTLRVAAAAALSFFLGGALVYETVRPEVKVVQQAPVSATSTPVVVAAAPETTDPWQSEELKDFHAVVQWESWVSEGKNSL